MFCINCGTQMQGGSNYCSHCGKKVHNDKSPSYLNITIQPRIEFAQKAGINNLAMCKIEFTVKDILTNKIIDYDMRNEPLMIYQIHTFETFSYVGESDLVINKDGYFWIDEKCANDIKSLVGKFLNHLSQEGWNIAETAYKFSKDTTDWKISIPVPRNSPPISSQYKIMIFDAPLYAK